MSIRLNKEGQVVITCREQCCLHEEHYQQIQSLIEIVQQRDDVFTHREPINHALNLLEDMMPEETQWRELLSNI